MFNIFQIHISEKDVHSKTFRNNMRYRVINKYNYQLLLDIRLILIIGNHG